MGQGSSTAEASRQKPGCIVAAGTRVCTREGLPAVESLLEKTIEVWTSEGWQRARVQVTEELRVVRITFSDGTSLECSLLTYMPVVTHSESPEGSDSSLAGASPARQASRQLAVTQSAETRKRRLKTQWSQRTVAELASGDRVTPTPTPENTTASGVDAAAAFKAGQALGAQVLAYSENNPRGLPPDVRGDFNRPGYGVEAVRAFVEGWAQAQRGLILGCPSMVADLAALLRRAGVRRLHVERAALRSTLVIDERDAWGELAASDAKKVQDQPGVQKHHWAQKQPHKDLEAQKPELTRQCSELNLRRWLRRLRTSHQIVTDIELTNRTECQYEIILGNTLAAVSLGNTMVGFSPRAATELVGYIPPSLPLHYPKETMVTGN